MVKERTVFSQRYESTRVCVRAFHWSSHDHICTFCTLPEDRGFEVVLAEPPGDSDEGIIEALLEGERLEQAGVREAGAGCLAINEGRACRVAVAKLGIQSENVFEGMRACG